MLIIDLLIIVVFHWMSSAGLQGGVSSVKVLITFGRSDTLRSKGNYLQINLVLPKKKERSGVTYSQTMPHILAKYYE